MAGRVLTSRDGPIGTLIFDHPERRNAISASMWAELSNGIEDLAKDDGIRVVILRGAGEHAFVSGADVSEFESRGAASEDRGTGNAILTLGLMEKPVICLIHGFCMGGGVAIALGADLRYAAEDAVFAIPAARLGLGYPMPGLENLVQVVGLANAKEIFFTSRRFSADEALRMGLVNGVFPRDRLEGAVLETATRIAENAPLTLRSVKTITREIARPPAERDHEAVHASIRACMESEDYREGVRAFMEKRRPVFKGR